MEKLKASTRIVAGENFIYASCAAQKTKNKESIVNCIYKKAEKLNFSRVLLTRLKFFLFHRCDEFSFKKLFVHKIAFIYS